MRHKCRFSFSILMISSCLVQVASAAEKGSLKKLESVASGGTIPKGSALITILPPISNITIEDGGLEMVENGGSSIKTTIQKGGMQIVTRGATAVDVKVRGGKQFVFEESFVNSDSVTRKSSAYDAKVFGDGDSGAVGQQNIYDGGMAWKTEVGQGGEQNLYMGPKKEGGVAENTIVSENGRQHVLEEGRAVNTTLNGEAVQVAYPGGVVDGVAINDHASSWIYVGAELTGEIQVNNKGYLYLFAGDATNHITKEKLSVEGRNSEVLFSVGMRNNKDKPQISIESLSGNGGTVSFSSIPYDPHHISLHVENLSGSLHFQFNISARGDSSDYLSISEGAGNHKISVADSGREITGSFLQKNGHTTQINLVTDRSQNGGANFTLADSSGEKIESVDGGAYMYYLYKRDRSADFSGDAAIWYLGIGTTNSEHLSTVQSRIQKKPKTTTFSNSSSSRSGMSSQQSPSSQARGSTSRNTNGKQNNKSTPKQRPPRHLREAQHVSASPLEDHTVEISRPAFHHHALDEKQQPIAVSDSSSLADQIILRPSEQDQPSPQSSQELSVAHFLTTPSTDAVLSMSVVPGLVFHNELQTVRVGRGVLDRSQKNAAFWTYGIKSKETLATGHTDFKLEQTGIVLGISGLSEWANGDVYISGFGSYDQARVAHARGGVSGINTYSVGAYAAYFDQSGWYLDSILKYNHFENSLKAISTNGLAIDGNYNQWAVGSSFETGYRFKIGQSSWLQPYAQFTWLQVEDKEIKLSNEMTGDIGRLTSLRSEVGLSLGYEFGLGVESSSLAYLTAAWLRENKDDNHTTINQQHPFTTDLSGNAGKIGFGLSGFVSDKLKLYAQAHYIKGRKSKQSLQGILGVRYSF